MPGSNHNFPSPPLPMKVLHLIALIAFSIHLPPLSAAQVKLAFSPGPAPVKLLLDALDGARDSVDACIFDFTHPDLAEALCHLAGGRKVRVRLLLDCTGEDRHDRALIERMASHGVQVLAVDSLKYGKAHLKAVVIDRSLVLTGSANWTRSGLGRNCEDLLAIEDATLARGYTELFDKVAQGAKPLALTGRNKTGRAFGAPTQKMDLPTLRRHASAVRVDMPRPPRVFLSPGNPGGGDLLLDLSQARESVTVAMYCITDGKAVAALSVAQNRGVKVRVLLDGSMGLDDGLRAVLKALKDAGVPVAVWTAPQRKMHLKAVLIDGRIVWTGSANLSVSSQTVNLEDMLRFESAPLCRTYDELIQELTDENGNP